MQFGYGLIEEHDIDSITKSYSQKVKEETNYLIKQKYHNYDNQENDSYNKTDSDALYNLTTKPSYNNMTAYTK